MKKLISLFMTAIILFSTIATDGVTVKAASAKPKFEYKDVFDYVTFTSLDYTRLYIKNTTRKSKISNIKISDTSVISKAKVKFYDLDISSVATDNTLGDWWYLDLTFKNPGTTTISCTVKQKGKTYKISCKYTVYEWVNPIKLLIVGEETFNGSTKGFFTTWDTFVPESEYSYENTVEAAEDDEEDWDGTKLKEAKKKWKEYASSVPIEVSLKKGYKLKKAYIGKEDDNGTIKNVKTFKNGKSVNLTKKNADYIVFVIYDSKNKCTFELDMLNVWGQLTL